MKKIILFATLCLSSNLFSQVIISPYVVYMDEQEKFGTFIVQNEFDQEYEISISFIFGHPKSDSLGNVSMQYYQEPTDTLPSIVSWLRAFPRNFILQPKQKQIIRMTVRPPDSLTAGTRWARIVTQSVPKAPPISNQSTGISAKINFVLNQVTTVLYRKNPAETGIEVSSIKTQQDSSLLNILVKYIRSGNSPFWADITLNLLDSLGNSVADESEYMPVYLDITKKYSMDISKVAKGNYTLEIQLIHNEKEDIPQSKLIPKETLIRKIDVEIN